MARSIGTKARVRSRSKTKNTRKDRPSARTTGASIGKNRDHLDDLPWRSEALPPELDIACLLPPTLAVGKRFETLSDADRYNGLTVERLIGGRHPCDAIAYDIAECGLRSYVCLHVNCSRCARSHRRGLVGEVLRLLHRGSQPPAWVITVYLKEVPIGELDSVDLAALRGLLRKRISRSGLIGAVVIGGIEAAYKADRGIWLFHAHLLVLRCTETEIEDFRERYPTGDAPPRAITKQNLKDAAEQISYLFKFGTFYRPFKQEGPTRPPAVALKKPRCRELVLWMDRYRFLDFLFLYGAKRRGHRLDILR